MYLNYENIEDMFNNPVFKSDMNMNIKHILLDKEEDCEFMLSKKHNECFTDGKKIVVGFLDEFKDLTVPEAYGMIKALVGHEASHVRWSNFKDLESFRSQVSKKGYNLEFSVSIANIMEDGRIERLLCDDLPGYKKYIDYMNITLIYNNGYIENGDFLSNIFNTMLFISKFKKYPLNFTSTFNKEEQTFFKSKITPNVLSCIYSNSHSTLLDSAMKIIESLIDFCKDMHDAIEEPELKEIIDRNINPGYSTSEGKNSKCLDKGTIEFNGINYHENDLNNSKMDLNALDDNSNYMEIKDFNKIKAKIKHEFYKVDKLKKINDLDKSNMEIQDNYFENINLESINNSYSEKLQENNFKYEYANGDYMQYPEDLALKMRLLEDTFRQILTNDYSLSRNKRRGRIDSSSLWKIDTIYDNKVFKSRDNDESSDYGVYILIDMSASMSSTVKYKEAINTAMTLEGSLLNLTGVEVKTVGFNYVGETKMTVFKDFKERQSRLPNALNKDYSDGCNRDGFAIRVALDDLEKHNSKNNLLIVISDGRPFWDKESPQDAMKDVKEAVNSGRKLSTIVSILLNEGNIHKHIRDSFNYMYDERGTVMVDVLKDESLLMNTLVFYLKELFYRK